jgi:hypothetical protein
MLILHNVMAGAYRHLLLFAQVCSPAAGIDFYATGV